MQAKIDISPSSFLGKYTECTHKCMHSNKKSATKLYKNYIKWLHLNLEIHSEPGRV